MNHARDMGKIGKALENLNATLTQLQAKTGKLSNNEARFIDKVKELNRMAKKNCPAFKLCFLLSEAHWLHSSIKYDESFELYSAMHDSYLKLLDATLERSSSIGRGVQSLDKLLRSNGRELKDFRKAGHAAG